MVDRLSALLFIVIAYICLCLQSSHHPSIGRNLPPSVLAFAGDTRLVSPLPPTDSSPAQRTASPSWSQTNPLVQNHGEVLTLYPSDRRALDRFRVVLLPGFPLEIFKPPILSF